MSLPLVPLQNAAPHGQSKQQLRPFSWIPESVECLVCIEEDLRQNIFTDFASINWLTVSFQNIYIWTSLEFVCYPFLQVRNGIHIHIFETSISEKNSWGLVEI